MSNPILFIDEPIPQDAKCPPPVWVFEHTLPCGCTMRCSEGGIVHIATCFKEPGQKCEDKE